MTFSVDHIRNKRFPECNCYDMPTGIVQHDELQCESLIHVPSQTKEGENYIKKRKKQRKDYL